MIKMLTALLITVSMHATAIEQDRSEAITPLVYDTMINDDELYGVKADGLIRCSALILASEYVAKMVNADADIGNEDLLMQAAINTLKHEADRTNKAFSFDVVTEEAKATMIMHMKTYVNLIVKNLEQDSNGSILETDMLACSKLASFVSARVEP